jgi:hypothetical protein
MICAHAIWRVLCAIYTVVGVIAAGLFFVNLAMAVNWPTVVFIWFVWYIWG